MKLLYVPYIHLRESTTRQNIAVTYKLSLRDLPLCIAKFEKRIKKEFFAGKLQNMNVGIMKREREREKVHESIDDLHSLRMRCVTMETIFVPSENVLPLSAL